MNSPRDCENQPPIKSLQAKTALIYLNWRCFAMAKEIIGVAQPLGISVHDHIIVGRDGHPSLKVAADLSR
jgi:hypothetical protein